MSEISVDLDLIPTQPDGVEGAIFQTPWQAKAFAMAVQLSESGVFAWSEFASVFSGEVKTQEQRGYVPEEHYYACWVRALEKVLAHKGQSDSDAMEHSVAATLEHWPHPEHIAQRHPILIDPARG